jgi:hypothetical protein
METDVKVINDPLAAFYDHHHHQPINLPTAGAQALLMDYPRGERAITHHAGPVRIGGYLLRCPRIL